MTNEELLAMKAVLYLALSNPRLMRGGYYIEDVHNYDTCGKIRFNEAVSIVERILYEVNTY